MPRADAVPGHLKTRKHQLIEEIAGKAQQPPEALEVAGRPVERAHHPQRDVTEHEADRERGQGEAADHEAPAERQEEIEQKQIHVADPNTAWT